MDIPNQVLISVVMPNYNGEKYISESIQTVINQTYKKIEFIIVDDCSNDNSIDIIQRYANKDNRIILITNAENRGVSFSRNLGIQKATGMYVALIDSDDTWELDKLERQLFLAQEGNDIVYCSYDFIDKDGKQIKKPFIVPSKTSFSSMLSSSVISCSTAFIKTDLLKQHPFHAEYYHEDYVLWMELLQLPVTAMGDKKVLMHYRQSAGSRSNKKVNAAKNRWKVYRKALNLSFPVSVYSFLSYSIKGIIKYYL